MAREYNKINSNFKMKSNFYQINQNLIRKRLNLPESE